MKNSTSRHAAGKRPADGFPLWRHPSGRWCKKVRGRAHYFGRIDRDPDGAAALNEWLRVKDDLLAGRRPRPKGAAGLTVGKLCNLFLATVDARIHGGGMVPRARRDYQTVTDRLVAAFGPGRSVEDLGAGDFEGLLAALPKTWGTSTRSLFVAQSRAVFNYCHNRDQQLIPRPVPFGIAFRAASKKQWRRHRAQAGQRLFDPAELRKAIDAAGIPFKAAILLGINAGFGNSDIAQLPWSAVQGEWIDFPRPKTAEPRRGWLWPETRAALEEVRQQGRKPAAPADAWRVFLTRAGNPWVRLQGNAWTDAVCVMARDLFGRLGITGRSFYDLRRTFRTVADEVLDAPAINFIMGHADPSMGALYRQGIDDARVRRVCEYVRCWLFGCGEGGA